MRPEDRLEQLFDAERRVEASADARDRIRQRLLHSSSLEPKHELVRSGPLRLGPSLGTKLALVVLGSAAAAAAVWGVDSARRYDKTSEVVRPIPSVPARPATSRTPRHFARPAPAPAPEAATETVDSEPSARAQPAAAAPLAPSSSAAREPGFDEELSLLKAAKRELDAGRPHLAKVWLDEHASRFPRGTFAVEREGLQILIACSSASAGAGQEQARAFRARYPASPLVDRLWRRCFPASEPQQPAPAAPVPENVESGTK